MELGFILGTGVAAGVITFLLNLIKESISDHRKKENRAKQQAFELSNKLKILSLTCEEIIGKHELAEPPQNQEFPDPPEFPKQNFLELTRGLPDLDTKDLARIADLEMQRIVEDSHIRFGWQTWMDAEDIKKIQLKRLEFLAGEAKDLAVLVREKHGLPAFGDHSRLIRDD
jgi:hypothetical protein